MKSIRTIVRRSAVLLMAFLAACETIHNADTAKMEVMQSADPKLSGSAQRVKLTGFQLTDYVDFKLHSF